PDDQRPPQDTEFRHVPTRGFQRVAVLRTQIEPGLVERRTGDSDPRRQRQRDQQGGKRRRRRSSNIAKSRGDRERRWNRREEKEARSPGQAAVPRPPLGIDEDQADQKPQREYVAAIHALADAGVPPNPQQQTGCEKNQASAEREENRKHAEEEWITEARLPGIRHDRLITGVVFVPRHKRAPAADPRFDQNQRRGDGRGRGVV